MTRIAALLILCCMIIGCGKDDDGGKGSIYGTVTDFSTGNPVSYANVHLLPSGENTLVETTLTGYDGHYDFLDVPSGNYSIKVTKDGYKDLMDDFEIKVTEGKQTKRDLQIEKLPFALRVVNSEGDDISSLDFGSEVDVNSRTFSIFNDSPQPLTWWIEENCSWITEVKSMLTNNQSGQIGAGKQEPIKVTIDRSLLGLGLKTYLLNINSDNGSKELFITAGDEVGLPSLVTESVSNLTQNSVTFNGKITNDGSPIYTERGFVYSTSPQPTINENLGRITSAINGQPSFSENLNGFTPNTTYYVSAYAINLIGEAYGDVVEFTTTEGFINVTTSDVTNIGSTSATCGGTVSLGNGNTLPVTARGICYSTHHNPTISDDHTSDGIGVGNYISSISGLALNTTYYVRAYAVNDIGPFYGEEKSFKTKDGLAIVTTKSITNIHPLSATGGGNVTSDNGFAVTVKGICWSTYQNPTIDDNHTSNVDGLGEYNDVLEDLQNSTTYHVRAYATNENGTAYGDDVLFTTSSGVINVVTNEVSGIGETSATCGGNATVTNDNNLPVTAKGVCWSTSHNPTINDNHTESGLGTGSFVSSITGLTSGSIYHVRAYAINQLDVFYGDEKTFATKGAKPSVSLDTHSFEYVSITSVRCTSNATSDGGLPITERGVCWSSIPNPTINDSHTSDGTGTGYYASTLTNLNSNTTYYVRAYAKNLSDISYSEPFVLTPDYRTYLHLPRFVYNGNTYVVYPDLGSYMSWTTANTACNNLVLAGFSDWRLPDIDELYYMYLNSHSIGGFTCIGLAYYWSSSVYNNNYHYYIDFADGNIGNDEGYAVDFTAYVRPVRVITE